MLGLVHAFARGGTGAGAGAAMGAGGPPWACRRSLARPPSSLASCTAGNRDHAIEPTATSASSATASAESRHIFGLRRSGRWLRRSGCHLAALLRAHRKGVKYQ